MVKRIVHDFFSRDRWTVEKVKKELKRKRKSVKRLRIRGVIGKQKRTLERMKTFTFSLLDRYIVKDLGQLSSKEEIFRLLSEMDEDQEKIWTLYERALDPYHKEVKEKFQEIKDNIRISRVQGKIYLSPDIKYEVKKSERMPLIQYLQGKLRVQQLLYFGVSGLYLVHQYLLNSLPMRTQVLHNDLRHKLRKSKQLEQEIKDLQHRLKRDQHILFKLVKAEKQDEETTFTIKKDEKWEEEEF